ncbi:hypothetical protein ABGN05_14705 [Aquibium sp. LZ166]|uniref:Uncharacterized protein n=1 Tax=Aquibium pacificus TaxID=3153579 RepID=A0ABV3SJG6_9HYPH
MFAVTPYSALRHVISMKDGKTVESWEQCRVVGIDATKDEPQYLVEIFTKGSSYVDRADMIRKEPA